MPEAAPVMTTTLPATSSVKKNEPKKAINNLGNRKSGRNRHNKSKMNGGAACSTHCVSNPLFFFCVMLVASSINGKGELILRMNSTAPHVGPQ